MTQAQVTGVDEDGKEIVDVNEPQPGFEIPAVLLRDDSTGQERTEKRIECIYVFRKMKSGPLSYQGWKTVADLPDYTALLEQYGPGTYRLQGRGSDQRAIIRENFVTVGDEVDGPTTGVPQRMLPPPRAEVDIAKIVAAIATAAAPILTIWISSEEKRRAEDRERREQEREREREREQQQREQRERELGVITQALTARNVELGDLLKGLLQMQQGGDAGAGGSTKSFIKGQESALELLALLQEGGLGGAKDDDSKLIDLLQSFVAGFRQPVQGAVAPPAPPPAPAPPALPQEPGGLDP